MGYALKETEYRYRAWTKDGIWQMGKLTTDKNITIHEGSNVFHYGQGLFEGLKAYKTKSGKIQLFRPDMNFIRINEGLDRIVAPRISEELFFDAIEQVVRANKDDIEEVANFIDGYFEQKNLSEAEKKSNKLCSRGLSAAKSKFKVYPSAYANGYAVQVCKGKIKGLDGKKQCSGSYCSGKK